MNNDPFYQTAKWQRVRKKVLMRDKYMDAELRRYGKLREAEVVHHIFPKDEFPQYAYELWNLISLTRSTHNAMHNL